MNLAGHGVHLGCAPASPNQTLYCGMTVSRAVYKLIQTPRPSVKAWRFCQMYAKLLHRRTVTINVYRSVRQHALLVHQETRSLSRLVAVGTEWRHTCTPHWLLPAPNHHSCDITLVSYGLHLTITHIFWLKVSLNYDALCPSNLPRVMGLSLPVYEADSCHMQDSVFFSTPK